MAYNFSVLNVRPGTADTALRRLGGWLQKTKLKGDLLGCWYSEVGELNRILMIHDYGSYGGMAEDRDTVFSSNDPYGLSDSLLDFSMEAYSGFPGVSKPADLNLGPIYEVRTYRLNTIGLAPTLEAWNKVLEARQKISPLLMVMYARSGSMPRFVHIWSFRTFEERLEKRAKSVEVGAWPPPNGLDYIVEMKSEIYLPAPFSPAQ